MIMTATARTIPQPSPALDSSTAVHLRDLFALSKPRVSLLVMCTCAAGIYLAPGHLPVAKVIAALLLTALTVGAANTLNCYLEKDIDARMLRTRGRPLPAGRVEPKSGLLMGLSLAIFAIPALTFILNPLTGFLGLVALVSYVGVYTPLKKVTPKALIVGAVPGAIPPLMGWTVVTGSLDLKGFWLFLLMFVWQLPHFLAITLYLHDDYARGGLRVLPVVRGEVVARRHLLLYTVLLVLVSLGFTPLRMAGGAYLAVAILLGAAFLWLALALQRPSADPGANERRARWVFLYSIGYLTLLFMVLLMDTGHRRF
jgi:protoheme IX farnesyltransferase